MLGPPEDDAYRSVRSARVDPPIDLTSLLFFFVVVVVVVVAVLWFFVFVFFVVGG